MRVIDWLRRNPLEAAWAVFAAANWVAMVWWPAWETIPFHFVWISLTFVYGVRVWRTRTMSFVLLQYLMGKQGLPASRQDLLSDVWGVDFDMGSNVVDVTIGRLRSKLGDDVIETVRHVGYRVGAA